MRDNPESFAKEPLSSTAFDEVGQWYSHVQIKGNTFGMSLEESAQKSIEERKKEEEIDLKQILADQKERTILKATPDDDITEGQAQRLAELPRSHELSKRAKECNEALDRIIRSKTQNDKVCGLMEEAIMRSIDTALHHHVLEHSLSCLVSGNH